MNRVVVVVSAIAVSIFLLFWLFGGGGSSRKDPDALEVWHWMTDRHEALLNLAEKYQTETGQAVKFILNAPSEVYTSKVRAAAQTQTLPDIYGILGESRDLANFIKSGLVLDLTPEMEKDGGLWKSSFFSKAIEMNAFDETNTWGVQPGVYGVPLDVMNIQMIYNRDIFNEAGITKIPETWEEFIGAGIEVSTRTKKNFFVSGFGETWLILSMVRNFAYNLMGEENYIATLRGEIAYDDPRWIAVFEKFQQMQEYRLYAPGIVTMINKQAERMFATNGAAVTFNGSWCVNVYKGMNPNLKYGTMFFPRISDDYPLVVMGGAGSSFVVSGNSTKADQGVAFLKWLTNADNQIFLSRETNNLPSNPAALGQMPPILNEFAGAMENTIHPFLLPVMEDPSIDEAIGKGIQSMIIGETTPDKLARDVAALKKRSLRE